MCGDPTLTMLTIIGIIIIVFLVIVVCVWYIGEQKFKKREEGKENRWLGKGIRELQEELQEDIERTIGYNRGETFKRIRDHIDTLYTLPDGVEFIKSRAEEKIDLLLEKTGYEYKPESTERKEAHLKKRRSYHR